MLKNVFNRHSVLGEKEIEVEAIGGKVSQLMGVYQ